jgi:three-Cys-motif partner protein
VTRPAKPQLSLFALAPPPQGPEFRALRFPIWTENKARLIERYLYYFVLITKHGTYIDGFAGPQDPSHSDTWAAKLVLESEPRWLRHFYLFDLDPEKYRHLVHLRDSQPPRRPKEPRRSVEVVHGDFNVAIRTLLARRPFREKEATFCLLDQHTMQCDWATVRALAAYKPEPKIEIFYFFPVGWLGRAMAARKDLSALDRWWGDRGWRSIERKHYTEQTAIFAKRFRSELGYINVHNWPIYKSSHDRRVMYEMIHATDHKDAPFQMYRAYHRAVTPRETPEQTKLELGL